MDLKRRTIEALKQQIIEGKFASNNDLVNAIKNLYNQARMVANGNPLLEEFLKQNNYMEFTKEITQELTDFYKDYQNNMKKDQNINEMIIEGQKVNPNQISEVNINNNTYFKVKDDNGDYKLFNGEKQDVVSTLTNESISNGQNINDIATNAITDNKVNVNLTDLDDFEIQSGLSLEDHRQAALARSMETYTGQEMAVNKEHDVIVNTETGQVYKIGDDGKVRTFEGNDLGSSSNITGEQFVLPDNIANELSVEDIDIMLNDPQKYNLSPETVNGLAQTKEEKILSEPQEEKVMEKGFQKVLKLPTNFKTSAFVDIFLVALIAFGFSTILVIRLMLLSGI